MIRIDDLIADFEEALERRCPYDSPGSTQWSKIDEGVDCSGLFAAAFARHGGRIAHGSNTIARQHVEGLERIASQKSLRRGDVVFKWRESGEPEKFTADGLGDFHHIGLVTQVSPLRIIHASSAAGCVTCDTSAAKWHYAARLKNVSGDQEVQEIQGGEETVMTQPENGCWRLKVRTGTLRIREEPGLQAAVKGSLKKNAEVWADDERGGWYRLSSGQGWICGDYVQVLQVPETGNEDISGLLDLLEEKLNELAEGITAIEMNIDAAIEVLDALKGDGL